MSTLQTKPIQPPPRHRRESRAAVCRPTLRRAWSLRPVRFIVKTAAWMGLLTTALIVAILAIPGAQRPTLGPHEGTRMALSAVDASLPYDSSEPAPATPSASPSVPAPDHQAADAHAQLLALADATDIPARVLSAYQAAADRMAIEQPSCGVQWQLLAALGRAESNHGRSGGASVGDDGVAVPAIYGVALDGSRPGVVGSVTGSNGQPDRAMGPMQFISSTWAKWGSGGNPQDIDDASWAAARYACAGGRDLTTGAGRYAAALSYNHVDWYATNIQALYGDYLAGRPGTSFPAHPPADEPTPDPMASESASPADPGTGSPTAEPEPQPGPSATPDPETTATETPAPTETPTPEPTPTPTETISPVPSDEAASPTS